MRKMAGSYSYAFMQAAERLVGLHAVPCSLIDLNLPSPSLPDVRLSAHTSYLGGSCFKESSKKYIYICWGFPTGHFLNSSFTSVRREKDSLVSFLHRHVCGSLQLSFCCYPHFYCLPFLSYVNLGKRRTGRRRRKLEILPLPLTGSLSTLAPL